MFIASCTNICTQEMFDNGECTAVGTEALYPASATLWVYQSQIKARLLPQSALKGRSQTVFFNALLTCDMDDDDSYLCCTLGLTNPSQYCQSQNFVGNFKWFCTKWQPTK